MDKVYSYGEIDIPYISGYLAFLELPLIMDAVKKLTRLPDIYMFGWWTIFKTLSSL